MHSAIPREMAIKNGVCVCVCVCHGVSLRVCTMLAGQNEEPWSVGRNDINTKYHQVSRHLTQ